MSDANDSGDAPVASLPTVLAALRDPVRLEMVRRLSNAGASVRCGALYEVINKSTATHHFKILREAGVIERLIVDGQTCQRLRADDLDRALPGVLPPIVAAANRARARAGMWGPTVRKVALSPFGEVSAADSGD